MIVCVFGIYAYSPFPRISITIQPKMVFSQIPWSRSKIRNRNLYPNRRYCLGLRRSSLWRMARYQIGSKCFYFQPGGGRKSHCRSWLPWPELFWFPKRQQWPKEKRNFSKARNFKRPIKKFLLLERKIPPWIVFTSPVFPRCGKFNADDDWAWWAIVFSWLLMFK